MESSFSGYMRRSSISEDSVISSIGNGLCFFWEKRKSYYYLFQYPANSTAVYYLHGKNRSVHDLSKRWIKISWILLNHQSKVATCIKLLWKLAGQRMLSRAGMPLDVSLVCLIEEHSFWKRKRCYCLFQ